jgi:enamine deaminase RidA (YjgF/YER057c/UK114 family)
MIEEPSEPSRKAFVPAVWTPFYTETHIPAAVLSGETLRLTGHTGETADGLFSTDTEAQIRQTFLNIGLTLTAAGVQWSDVVEINSYHVGLATQAEALLRVATEFLEDPYPAWTAVGVTELIIPEALVEISCVAVVGQPA